MRRLLARDGVRAGLGLALVAALGLATTPDAFLRWSTHRGTLREASVEGIIACGMTLVIVAGGIDLSVGSVLALASVVLAKLTLELGVSAPLAMALVLAGGAALGGASGGLIARFKIQPFVVTLAAMVFARGLAKAIAGGKKVTGALGVAPRPALPALVDALDGRVLGDALPLVALVMLACALITHLVLTRLRLGRHIYAIGGNAEAARLAGVPVGRTIVAAYAISGALAALAGVCQFAQETQGDPETGAGYELDAIAMVVVGGTALTGGRGGVGLTLLGALTLGTLQKVLSLNAFDTDTRLMLTGVVVVAAAALQRRRR